MRTSRLWIERTVAELDGEVAIAPPASHTLGSGETKDHSKREFTLTLSADEVAALDDICRADELSPKQALTHIVRARLLGQPQFGRSDRARLRACLDLLRALEQHVGRAARPAKALRQTVGMLNARTVELLELGVYLRRIGRAIGESMLGNLEYWRGEPGATLSAPDDAGDDASLSFKSFPEVARERPRHARARP